MEVISKSGTFDKVDEFRMMNGKCDKMKDNVGCVIDCVGYMLAKTDDGEREILYVIADNGLILASNSDTVKRTFKLMCDTFGNPTQENPIRGITVTSATSSHGREFLDLDMVK